MALPATGAVAALGPSPGGQGLSLLVSSTHSSSLLFLAWCSHPSGGPVVPTLPWGAAFGSLVSTLLSSPLTTGVCASSSFRGSQSWPILAAQGMFRPFPRAQWCQSPTAPVWGAHLAELRWVPLLTCWGGIQCFGSIFIEYVFRFRSIQKSESGSGCQLVLPPFPHCLLLPFELGFLDVSWGEK